MISMTHDPARGPDGTPVAPTTTTRRSGAALQAAAQAAPKNGGFEERAYLRDYVAMLEATPFPSLVFDHRWNVVAANSAYDTIFRHAAPHPTAMPRHNFLRFVLFHPDAATVLGEHETSWCLPLLAQFSAALEKHGDDPTLREIRRGIARDPLMDAAYRQGLPQWMRLAGPGALDHDGSVRRVNHPDAPWGRTTCRIINETPATLRKLNLTRLTLVLHQGQATTPRARATRSTRVESGGGGSSNGNGNASGHLRVVPTAPEAR
ncbi:MmyB family transcriptional regulator [Streptomyces sp. NPDC002851]